MTTQAGITVRVPAKVNLGLVVGGPRRDGYHELATVFHAISLYDDVTATPADEITVTVEGSQAEDVPTGTDNIAVRAALLLAERAGVPDGVHLHIRKGIPVAGGMAGGSADAAAALVACDALWRVGLSRDGLCELAAELGADVPFSVLGGTAIGTGRGERLTAALARGEHHWVVALAGYGLSTATVYAELDRLRADRVLPVPRVPDRLMKALRSGDPAALGASLVNDMQPAACSLAPSLRRTLHVGRDAGALGGLVSGSGPTVVFLARDAEHALDLSVALTASGTVRDVRRARGPVPGARIVDQPR
ncbi:MAG: 4-(cytidine 5'-diphospho)-2-C-methyl-D-erythritol kinase [Actinomycetales bacterium]|nr:4-(cytidine 5'-diphospho)-2-C-methyl-D-erythritol kinase [Actinomycetales bacterium]